MKLTAAGLTAVAVIFIAGLTAVSGFGRAHRRRARSQPRRRVVMNGATSATGMLVVGLNPAAQTILSFNDLRNGGVNRATKLENGVSPT